MGRHITSSQWGVQIVVEGQVDCAPWWASGASRLKKCLTRLNGRRANFGARPHLVDPRGPSPQRALSLLHATASCRKHRLICSRSRLHGQIYRYRIQFGVHFMFPSPFCPCRAPIPYELMPAVAAPRPGKSGDVGWQLLSMWDNYLS